jgi:hypothetical protein
MKAMLQFAVDQGLLAENPAKEAKVRVRKKVKETGQERISGTDGTTQILGLRAVSPLNTRHLSDQMARRFCAGMASRRDTRECSS